MGVIYVKIFKLKKNSFYKNFVPMNKQNWKSTIFLHIYIYSEIHRKSFKSRSSGFYIFSKSGESIVESNMKIKVI